MAAAGVGASTSSAADEPSAPTVSVNVKVVNVLATVRDKHGKILPDLNKNDFALQEDSHPVSIQYFSKESNLPLTLGLMVDTSLSQRNVLDQEKSASKTFLDQVLRDKDTAFLIHFDKEVELLQDLTASHEKLDSAIARLEPRSLRDEDNSSRTNGPGSNPDDNPQAPGRGRGMHRAGTTLYDAIYLASNELMKKQQGRKALVILSDGVDRGSKESLESAIEAAQRADTLVYSVYFKGEENFGERRSGFGFPGMGGPMGGGRRGGGRPYPQEEHVDGKKILDRISKETGGRMFEASSKKDQLDKIYAGIEEELRNQYNLGFTPGKDDSAGYHKLQLTTKQKDDQIQTRAGFYLEQ
jgi:VWFA-related protein